MQTVEKQTFGWMEVKMKQTDCILEAYILLKAAVNFEAD